MEGRVEIIAKNEHKKNVLYLMQRDHRIEDNYSMLLSQNLAQKTNTELFVASNVDAIKKNKLQEAFMFEGLIEMNLSLKKMNIDYFILTDIEVFCDVMDVDCIVTEFSPLREYLEYQTKIKNICLNKKIAFYICDSHNIVPCKNLNVYMKSSSGVKTRLYKYWNQSFKEFESVSIKNKKSEKVFDVKQNKKSFCKFDSYAIPKTTNYTEFKGGYSNGMKELQTFFEEKFSNYKSKRNDANVNFLSNLSPWVHFGQIGAQRILLEAFKRFKIEDENLDCFANEIFVWKETAEHFCHHEKNYDNINGALPWAKETLRKHLIDKREEIYTYERLSKALTSDDQWNAGQKEMVLTGKMHGYVRMYWAKTIVYWTKKPETALKIAIKLNDEFSIDGNDPIGYLGIMWSICGSMDQGWGERNIVGKIRCMRNIKAKKYVTMWKTKKIS